MFATICFAAPKAPSEKGSTLEIKNLVPMGANSFFLEETYFQKGGKNISDSYLPWKLFIPVKSCQLI